MQAQSSSVTLRSSDEKGVVVTAREEIADGNAVNLALLPADVIEEITEWLRYPILQTHDHNEIFLNEGRTVFSATRFHLSAFSRVCSSIRPTVERILYRDIHLDNVGWIHPTRRTWVTSKHYAHPAASLPLLLRTLDQRPELAKLIRGVDLRWCDDYYKDDHYLETRRFLWMCERLNRLSVDFLSWTFIERVLTPSPDSPSGYALGISHFSTSCDSRYMELLPTLFPRLASLQIHLHGQSLPSRESELPISPNLLTAFTSSPKRKLMHLRVKLHVQGEVAHDTLFSNLSSRVLSLTSTTVEDLYIEGRPTLNTETAPVLSSFQPPNCQNIRYLCLRDVDPFHTPSADPLHPSDSVGQSSIPPELPLAYMPSLTHLLLIRPRLLPPYAFSLLPPSVKTVSFSSYGVDSKKSSKDSKTEFVKSVIAALVRLKEYSGYAVGAAGVRPVQNSSDGRTLRLTGIKTYGAIPGDHWDLGDLRPLMIHCKSFEPKIPFREIGAGNTGDEPELILFFSSSI